MSNFGASVTKLADIMDKHYIVSVSFVTTFKTLWLNSKKFKKAESEMLHKSIGITTPGHMPKP
jgi:hypothetical protein